MDNYQKADKQTRETPLIVNGSDSGDEYPAEFNGSEQSDIPQ